jgi:hypothetical protein
MPKILATLEQIGEVIAKAREVAFAYYRLTGKPLGITGEVGEYEAARLLDLTLAAAREAGYDAIDRRNRKLQIKARAIPTGKKLTGLALGKIDVGKPWDAVIMILMDDEFRPTAIYEASRKAMVDALGETDSKSRKRGVLRGTKFKSISEKVWPTAP